MEVKEMIELMRAVSENGLTEFELERDEWKLSMKRGNQAGIENIRTAAECVTESVQETTVREEVSGNIVKCPLVGTFYSAPSPEAESFVKVGDHVKKGQILGIVEAMKLMNEIESEYDGVVGQVLVGNGETVEYGQPMFEIR